jgi:hypothetical protein
VSAPGKGTVVTVYLDVIPTRDEIIRQLQLDDAVRIYGENEDWPTAADRRLLMTELSDVIGSGEYLPRIWNEKERAMKKRIGVYVHVPFCSGKCAYCDFTPWRAGTSRCPPIRRP